ncbi:DUF1540 domain-containing protein [Clostridium thermobutyricum]|uniref:DUF1540 domain-containing protein n=1 Tax=Clostridium thermobutyricum TaxID=29372 RepID=UPI003F5263B7
MPTLGCSVQNCVNNEGGFCGANTIIVDGEEAYTSSQTQCETYRPETLTNAFKAMTNTNFTGEIAQIFSSREEILITPEVECTAKNCFYNANNRCEARNIMIVENRENEMKNQCETFLDNH